MIVVSYTPGVSPLVGIGMEADGPAVIVVRGGVLVMTTVCSGALSVDRGRPIVELCMDRVELLT